jgi:hypothetical protein
VISGELGATGHPREMLELLLPVFDPLRHGPVTAYNLLQACIETQDLIAAEIARDRLKSALTRVPSRSAPQLDFDRLIANFDGFIASN